MTDKDWKNIYKFFIDHGYENLTLIQKELLKKAIDDANTFEELLVSAMVAIEANK